MIFGSAFGLHPVFGGIVGTAISMGVKRGIYSSEAGMGTATQYSGAAEVSHPVKQGLVQSFSVYIDTFIVCSATAFMVLMTGAYNVVGSDGGFIVQNLVDVPIGPMYTQNAVSSLIPALGAPFVAISLTLFAFTSLTGNYYVGETNLAYFIKKDRKWLFIVMKVVYLIVSYYSCLRATTFIWSISDVGIGLIVWTNLVGILLLSGIAFRIFKDYEKQVAEGKDPVFDPKKLNIKNAELWETINARRGK